MTLQQNTYQELTIKDLLESGAHFGHQTHRWNPKMARFIFEEKNGIYIIDLAKTMQQIREAVEAIVNMIQNRKSILFVGTKQQAKAIVRECAEKCGEFYVCERWLGGTLTNMKTIRQSVKTMERIEKKIASGGEGLKKKEISVMSKDLVKLERNLSGIRGMRKLPGLLVVVDPSREHIAVAEARKLGIPVMALVDTNCDPDPIDYVIACNDDALKSIKLILEQLSSAVQAKKEELLQEAAEEQAIAAREGGEKSSGSSAEEEKEDDE